MLKQPSADHPNVAYLNI